jgi:methylmalonyl-CoA/ethylmalonyl-CoA epimerase
MKLEHIGIAVSDLGLSDELFEKLLGKKSYKKERVDTESVITSFYDVGNTKVELLEGSNEDSPISRFINKKGQGVHHIAFAVDDIESEMNRLAALGFELLNEKPKKGADNKLICFLHPKTTNGVLIELCQEIRD